jgi:hypothetical protein
LTWKWACSIATKLAVAGCTFLLLPGEKYQDSNRALLARTLEGLPRNTQNPEISWNDLMEISDRLDLQAEEWSAPFIQPSEQAVLHRIIRGDL